MCEYTLTGVRNQRWLLATELAVTGKPSTLSFRVATLETCRCCPTCGDSQTRQAKMPARATRGKRSANERVDALRHKISRHERVGKVRFGYDLSSDGRQLLPNQLEQQAIALMQPLRRAGRLGGRSPPLSFARITKVFQGFSQRLSG